MANYNATGVKTFEASEAIAQYLRVKLDNDGTISVADASDLDIGTATREVFADDITQGKPYVGVRLKTAPGTQIMIASGTIEPGDLVVGDDGGKVQADDGNITVARSIQGIAMTGATANQQVEVMPRFYQ